ncbi:C40 family peptidase [Pedobacter sp. SAFR-022]|uniref:C40 family peptidase n=1 Tax=Pedobacter sp. SAFR-022 TaxID=3436861 RepID=UPI003F807E76
MIRRISYPFAMLLSMAVFFSACSSKRYVPSATKAAKAAEAMANLKNKQLYRYINEWSGVKYRLGGLDKRGIDCSGFTYLVQKDIYGKQLPRRSVDQASVIKEKNLNQLKEGDLIFFSFGGREIDHVGIYLNGDSFVHASPSRGIIVEDLSLPAFQRAIVKAGPINN